jgi:hypothetical protein
VFARKYEALHKAAPYHDGTFTTWSEHFSEGTPFHYDDGVTIWAASSDLSPDDRFLEKRTEQMTGGD